MSERTMLETLDYAMKEGAKTWTIDGKYLPQLAEEVNALRSRLAEETASANRWHREAVTLSEVNARQECRLAELERERDAEEARGHKLELCLDFFASVIKGGEQWTDACEQEYRSALLARPAATPPAPPESAPDASPAPQGAPAEEKARATVDDLVGEAVDLGSCGEDPESACYAGHHDRVNAQRNALVARLIAAPSPLAWLVAHLRGYDRDGNPVFDLAEEVRSALRAEFNKHFEDMTTVLLPARETLVAQAPWPPSSDCPEHGGWQLKPDRCPRCWPHLASPATDEGTKPPRVETPSAADSGEESER